MILTILGGLFLALCVFAALHDVNRLTIPNWLNLTLAALLSLACLSKFLAVIFLPRCVRSSSPLPCSPSMSSGEGMPR